MNKDIKTLYSSLCKGLIWGSSQDKIYVLSYRNHWLYMPYTTHYCKSWAKYYVNKVDGIEHWINK